MTTYYKVWYIFSLPEALLSWGHTQYCKHVFQNHVHQGLSHHKQAAQLHLLKWPPVQSSKHVCEIRADSPQTSESTVCSNDLWLIGAMTLLHHRHKEETFTHSSRQRLRVSPRFTLVLQLLAWPISPFLLLTSSGNILFGLFVIAMSL